MKASLSSGTSSAKPDCKLKPYTAPRVWNALGDWEASAARAKAAAELYRRLDVRTLRANAIMVHGYALMELAQLAGGEGQAAFDRALAAFDHSFAAHDALGNSFAEMVSRDHSEAPELARLITNPDRSSLLALLALRRLSPEDYRRLNSGLRTSILVDALEKSEYFNTWGLPHAHREAAARALMDAGPAARNALRELMKDRRAAPVWGLVEYQQYQYRVCDYAWAMVNVISGRELSIPQDPAERDRLHRADMD